MDVFRLDRLNLRQRNQGLTHALDNLQLLSGGELGKAERFILHFNFARAAQVDFIVRLYRDCRQHGHSHQHE